MKRISHLESKWIIPGATLIIIGLGIFSASKIKRENLPDYSSSDFQLQIVWNEPLSLDENKKRVVKLLQATSAEFFSMDLGISDITQHTISFFDAASIYLKASSNEDASRIRSALASKSTSLFPKATVSIKKAANTFEMIFAENLPPAEARIRKNDGNFFSMDDLDFLGQLESEGQLNVKTNETYYVGLFEDRINNSSIAYPTLIDHLKNLTDENVITQIKETDQSIPVSITLKDKTYFVSVDSVLVDLTTFYEIRDTTEVRMITSDLGGPYISFISDKIGQIQVFGDKVRQSKGWTHSVHGALLNNRANTNQLIFAGVLGIILLYLILVAQFESFFQPLIIFSLMPIAIFASLISLYVAGASLNTMSIIGILVMLGIIVNDSILKIDAINRNVRKGNSADEAIYLAKNDRFKPILMTSLSTILALIPIYFSHGIAADLQKPLATAIIGGLIAGTWSSIQILPILYKKTSKILSINTGQQF
ncbi:MAG: hypothetical protein Tsb0034_10270 [Ekhidna sp.]